MTLLATVAMYAWLPALFVAFALLPRRIAVTAAVTVGWCFLPCVSFRLYGLPDYTKVSATTVGTLLATLVFHTWIFTRFRLRLIDLPIILFCLSPFVSSMFNGLGWYDGVSTILNRTVLWGLPYFIGRLHFERPGELRDLAVAMIVCGLLYVPLCLYEVRMSPQLHNTIYGFMQHDFRQHIRAGGWRPMVFMNHGLQVSLWLSACFVLTAGFWYFAGQRRISIMRFAVPLLPIVIAFGVTLVLTKSLGALVLAIMALGCLFAARTLRARWPLMLPVIGCVFYLIGRGSGAWSAEVLIELATMVNENRASSLEFRIMHESVLAEHARQQMFTGWGGWGRNRPVNEYGDDTTVADGLWVLIFGMNGLFGLIPLYAALLGPPVAMISKLKRHHWGANPNGMIAASVAMLCIMATVDSLPNSMMMPIILTAIGAMAGIASNPRVAADLELGMINQQPRRRPRTRRAARPQNLTNDPISPNRPRDAGPSLDGPSPV
ncbi:MAG: O-antigen ligase domain-containing protein [Planctomycetota bacterium]